MALDKASRNHGFGVGKTQWRWAHWVLMLLVCVAGGPGGDWTPRAEAQITGSPVVGGQSNRDRTSRERTSRDRTSRDRSSRDRASRGRTASEPRSAANANPATGTEGVPARARPQEKSTVVRREAPQARRGGGSKSVPLPLINYTNKKDNALYFTPPQKMVALGSMFSTTLNYYHIEQAPVDSFDLWIKYDPDRVALEWVDIEPIQPFAGDTLEIREWKAEGLIQFKGVIRNRLDNEFSTFAEFHWKSLKPALNTKISIAQQPGRRSTVMAGGKDAMQPTAIGTEKVASASIRIMAPTDREDTAWLTAGDLRGEHLEYISGEEMDRLRLAMVSPSRFVETDGVSVVDIVLLNPAEIEFDEVKFRIRYDPRSIKILDADEGNYITEGINVFDGDFHGSYPFGIHMRNRVDPDIGLIEYHMVSSDGPREYPSGTLARIVFRMRRQAGRTTLRFERLDPLSGQYGTDVAWQGQTLLSIKEGQTAQSAMHGVELDVRPVEFAKVDASEILSLDPERPMP